MSWQDQYDEKVRSEALEMAAKIAEEVAKETGDGEGEIYIALKIANRIRSLKS